MKKFVAVLLPIILIGSLAMGITVAACPVEDPDARWDHVPRNQLPQLAERAIPTALGLEFVICPVQGGRVYPTGSTRMRWTPAGRAGEYAENHRVTIPAGELVVTTGQNAFFAWTMDCRSDSWIHVEWQQFIGVVAGVRQYRTHTGYVHSSQLRPWGSTCP